MKETYTYEELYRFTSNLFQHIGCSKDDANTVAEVLLAAELRGIPSHGLMRVSDYISMYEMGRINTKPNIQIVYETPTTIAIDADGCYGMIAAKYAMQKVIEKAQNTYSAWGTVINSTHYGIAGYYAMMLFARYDRHIWNKRQSAGCPHLEYFAYVRHQPLSVAIPAKSHLPFVADFATTPIARGKLALLEQQGKTIEWGFVQDKEGLPSNNPGILKDGGAIVPLGSDYEHGSHKGYCLSAIIDIFSSVLGGANFGPFVPPQVGYLKPSERQVGKGLGHFFGAIRIDAFRPKDAFLRSMDEWIETFKQAKPDKNHTEVLIPGEPEYRKEMYHMQHGISLQKKVYEELTKIAEKYAIDFP